MVLSTHDYVGGIEYKNEVLEAIYHAEGRVYFENGTPRYEYTITDHLGNTRLTFSDKDGDGVIDQSDDPVTNEVLQENHYYPFGMAMDGQWIGDPGRENKYRYNGKELEEDFGLNWYAYGARYYDPAIGRFTGVDPIADQFAWVSTYNYAENEPIAHIDLHGLQKYKPKMQPIESPRDLLSTKMLNNLWEGTKTATREFFSKDVGTAFKTTGSRLEYGGIAAGMAGQAEISVPVVAIGKTLDIAGTGIILVDELIENSTISGETAVELGTAAALEILPEPLEQGIDNLGLDEVATGVLKSQRDGGVKALEETFKSTVKSMISETNESSDKNRVQTAENCNDECNK